MSDALELDHTDVISTSLGAYVGLRSASATPDRIRRLVAVAAPLGAQGDERWPLMMRLTAVDPVARLMARLPAPRFVIGPMLDQLGLARARREGRLAEEAARWFQSVVNDTDSIRNEMNTLPAFIDPRGGLREGMELPDDVLSAIASPTLFLWGADDPFGGAAVARRFCARVPGSELRLLDGHGHVPWLDDLDAVAGPAINFLAV